jgi:hypothetical protein
VCERASEIMTGSVAGLMGTSEKDAYLSKSRAAATFARENLRAADAIKIEELYAQGFGLLLYAAEESTKAAIYLYAHLDLVTFDDKSDPGRLYFNEAWLTNHREKYSEFARVVSTDLLLAAAPDAVRKSDGVVTAVARLALIGFIVAYFRAWGDRFEELREMAFLSGPPMSGKTDIERPGPKEFEGFEPLVRSEIDRLEKTLGGPLDRAEVARDLPSRKAWQKFVIDRPRKEDLWVALQKFLEEGTEKRNDTAPAS